MRRFFSAMIVIIGMALSLPNLAMATPLVWKDINIGLSGQPFDASLDNFNPGPLTITQWGDGTVQILANMGKDGTISCTDNIWDCLSFKLFAIENNIWKLLVNDVIVDTEAYSNNGEYLNGLLGFDVNLEFFARPIELDPVEAPEPSSLLLLILALATLAFVRQHQSVRLSRIPAKS
jgi:hypothetical protein